MTLFEHDVTDSLIYGGKDNDTLTFRVQKHTITGGLVSGDSGNDIIILTSLKQDQRRCWAAQGDNKFIHPLPSTVFR